MSELTDVYTTEAIQNMTLAWFGKKLPVNDKVILRVYEIIEKSGDCTSSVDKVPYKLSGVTGVASKLSSIAIATIKRIIKNTGNDKHYIMCLRSVAIKERFEIELDAMGQ